MGTEQHKMTCDNNILPLLERCLKPSQLRRWAANSHSCGSLCIEVFEGRAEYHLPG